MGDEIAISVENISKVYRLYEQPVDRLKESLHPFRRKYHRDFHALDSVSFEVKKGETVGIIGQNGSGKSTLLKIITGVLTPSSGRVAVAGRISALLELGTGFNPELTGIENVFFSGTVMGYSRAEMETRLDAILSFADIGEFARQPVKTYSSGMFVRLAFAVGIVIEPEIMIVDEALSVGDMNFQAKCMTALDRIRQRGTTVLFVSHDIGSVKSLCSRCIYLQHGAVREVGRAADVADVYVRDMREAMNAETRRFVRVSAEFRDKPETVAGTGGARPASPAVPARVFKRSDEFDKRVAAFRYGSGGVRIAYAELVDMQDNPVRSVEFNQRVCVRIFIEAEARHDVSVNFYILDDKKILITGCGFAQAGKELLSTEAGGRYLVEYVLQLPLEEGSYAMQLQVTSPLVAGVTAEFLDVVEDAFVFKVNKWDTAKVWAKVHLFPELDVRMMPVVEE